MGRKWAVNEIMALKYGAQQKFPNKEQDDGEKDIVVFVLTYKYDSIDEWCITIQVFIEEIIVFGCEENQLQLFLNPDTPYKWRKWDVS